MPKGVIIDVGSTLIKCKKNFDLEILFFQLGQKGMNRFVYIFCSSIFSWRARYFKVGTQQVDTKLRRATTCHKNSPPTPRPPLSLPQLPPPQTMSVSEASDNDINEYSPGHMPMPDFKALAWDCPERLARI